MTKGRDIALLGLIATGCTGQIVLPGDPPSPAAGGEPAAGARGGSGATPSVHPDDVTNRPPPASACSGAPFAGPRGMRRLNNRELDVVLRSLLGERPTRAASLAPGDVVDGYDTASTDAKLSALFVEQLQGVVSDAVSAALANPTALVPCTKGSAVDAACARTFIADFATRAFRRPIDSTERDRLTKVFDAGRAAKDDVEGLRWALEAILGSPSFLFVVEQGRPDRERSTLLALTDHERAARLALLLWSGLPDAELRGLADAGRLSDPAVVRAQARRLLAAPQATVGLRAFAAAWLRIDHVAEAEKDGKIFPAWPALREQLLDHALGFVEDRSREGTFGELMTTVYATSGDQRERTGVLTHPAVMAALAGPAEPSPIERGAFVLDHVLCEDVPPPPPDVDAKPPVLDPNATIRSRTDAVTASAACQACHKRINALGHLFGHYDAIGRYQQTEGKGLAIEASADVAELGRVADAADLARKLAGVGAARTCFVRQWFRYAFGRHERDEDACTLATASTALEVGGDHLADLIVAFAGATPFLHREVQR